MAEQVVRDLVVALNLVIAAEEVEQRIKVTLVGLEQFPTLVEVVALEKRVILMDKDTAEMAQVLL
jgi:hypothetical protein